MRKKILISSVLLLASAISSLISFEVVKATAPIAYWEDAEHIKIRHPFFAHDDEEGRDSLTFKLDRYTRDGFIFKTEEAAGIKFTAYGNGNDSCTYNTFYFELRPEGSKWKLGGDYNIERTGMTDTPLPNAGVSVQPREGAVLNNDWDEMAPAGHICQKLFHNIDQTDGFLGDVPGQVSRASEGLRNSFELKGDPKINADLRALLDQLDRMFEREKKHFVQRVCSTHRDAGTSGGGSSPDCYDDAAKSYKIVWDYCSYKSRAVANAEQRVSDTVDCIQNQSGVSVNSELLDNTVFRNRTYADGASCSIRFIGWIICPISRFLAHLTDAAFDGLSQFLVIRPLNRGAKAGDALYSAWSLVNNVANVIFIIVFLLVVLSQVSGWGISNYGVKRLLPKLILTAILVNISYYVCVVAVDMSNILGKSLIDIISTLEPDAVNKPSTWSAEIENILVFVAGGAGVGMLLLTGSIVAMVPLLVGAAISFLVAILMIVARYAIVITLIIIAPFAIALSILPNTQKWYTQWYKLFLSMLLLFPMISIVFGTAKIAGILVLNSSLSRSTGDITLQLFGLAIQALPLALTPLLMKLSGGILNRFGGMASNQGFFGKTKERADGFAKRKKDARDVKGLTHFGANKRRGLAGARDKMIQRRYRRKALHSVNEGELNHSYANYISGYASGKAGGGGDKAAGLERGKEIWNKLRGNEYTPPETTRGDKFAQSLAKGGGSIAQVQADAINAQLSISAKEVSATKVSLASDPSIDMSALRSLASSEKTPETIRQAAIEMVTSNGSMDDINAVVKSSGNMSKSQRQVLVKNISSGGVARNAAYYTSPGAQQAILNGEVNSDDTFTQHVVSKWANSGEVSAENIGSMHAGGLQEVQKALASSHINSDSTIAAVSSAAKSAQASSSIRSKAHGTEAATTALNDIARLR